MKKSPISNTKVEFELFIKFSRLDVFYMFDSTLCYFRHQRSFIELVLLIQPTLETIEELSFFDYFQQLSPLVLVLVQYSSSNKEIYSAIKNVTLKKFE